MGQEASPDFNALRAEILAFHDAFIAAHVDNRPEFFTESIADDCINVSRGESMWQSKAKILDSFRNDLGNTRFSECRLLGEWRSGSPTMHRSRGPSSD